MTTREFVSPGKPQQALEITPVKSCTMLKPCSAYLRQ